METTNGSGDCQELDVEAFAKEQPDVEKPHAGIYIIRIDRDRKPVTEPELPGVDILALVRKTPETHKLFQKFCGGETEFVPPDKVVSFVKPGIERFQTIPKDTTEGGAR